MSRMLTLGPAIGTRLRPVGLVLVAALGLTGTHPQTMPVAAAQTPANTAADDNAHALTVTTDTLDYCDRLDRKLGEAANPPPGVRQLHEEGREMCAEGRIRGGIARLRRGLLALREQ